MAKATKILLPVKPVEPDYEVVLTLSKEEAETLRGVTQHIGGIDGHREHMNRIRRALYDAGIYSGFEESDLEAGNRAIYFKSVK